MSRQPKLRECLPGLWQILSRFRASIRQQRGLIIGSLILLLTGVGLRLLEPWPLKIVFDRVINVRADGAVAHIAVLDGLDPMTLLLLAALGVVLIIALRALADYGYMVGFALVSNRVLTEVRDQVYRHVQRLSLSFHTRAKSGDLLIRIIGDVSLLRDAAVTAALPLFANLLILTGMIVVMLWMQWQLALLVLLTAPLYWLLTVRIGRKLREVSRTQRQREGAMAATAAESLTGIQVVQTLGLEEVFAGDFASNNQRSLKEGVKASRLTARLERTVDVLIAAATALVLWFGARLVLSGQMTPGDLLVFLAYLKTAFRPVRDLAKYTGRLARATAAGERVLELLDREPDIRDLPDARPAPAFRGHVRFDGVRFGYEPNRWVLTDLDVEIPAGQRVALVGPSGIGKSTLVSLLLRLYDPVHGRVLIDGDDIRSFTLATLRAQISMVLQDSLLFAASVRENIGYGAASPGRDEIEAAARLANAHEFIQALPQAYDTVLGERGVTLSQGQRQRIAIARAAVRQSPILILDEPTTGLDEENEAAVIEALEKVAEGRTTFLITHDLRFAARANRIFYLNDGTLVEDGSPAHLFVGDGHYAKLYRLQTGPLAPHTMRNSQLRNEPPAR
jgi:ATP-binding cassette, subfamily B, bacterial